MMLYLKNVNNITVCCALKCSASDFHVFDIADNADDLASIPKVHDSRCYKRLNQYRDHNHLAYCNTSSLNSTALSPTAVRPLPFTMSQVNGVVSQPIAHRSSHLTHQLSDC